MDDRRPDPEHHELWASLALDDELSHDELLRLLDAMADDPRARDFWRTARATDRMLEPLRAATAAPRAVRTSARPAPRRRVWMRAAGAVAVVLVVAFGLHLLRPANEVVGTVDAVQVRLGEDAGNMDDQRFVELALELLRADRRYLDEMVDLLDDVQVHEVVPESAAHARRAERETRIARSEIGGDRRSPLATSTSFPAAF